MDRRIARAFVLGTLALAACGGDDATSPAANMPPEFREAPSAQPPTGLLLNVVSGDQILFSARGIDPDVEAVSYRWQVGREVGGSFVAAADAGVLAQADSATPLWTVGTLAGPVRVRCTLSDGQDSVQAFVGRDFAPGTPVSSLVVDVDTAFSAAGSPYVIKGNLTVAAGATLSIGPGVELQFRPDRLSGVSWEKRSLLVSGTLVVDGELQAPVNFHGGFSTSPAGLGPQQFRGIEVAEPGSVDLLNLRVVAAETGLRILSATASVIESTDFEDCITAVRVERGDGTLLRDCALLDNSVGVQLNSAGVTLEGCVLSNNSLYGIDVDGSGGPAGLQVEGTGFTSNLQAHLRMSAEAGSVITATVRGSNFLPQPPGTPSVRLPSPCGLYVLDLRGNYWGPVSGPAQIRDAFEGDKDCGADVMSWTDSDCGGDPEACDWSGQPW